MDSEKGKTEYSPSPIFFLFKRRYVIQIDTNHNISNIYYVFPSTYENGERCQCKINIIEGLTEYIIIKIADNSAKRFL